jgi:hypothetical protein
VDTLETLAAAIRDRLPLAGAATEATLSSILGAVDLVESKLDALNAKDFSTQTTLAAVLAALDQVEPKLDTLNAKDFATQATLALIKTRADLLATEATLATIRDQSSQFARVLKFEPAAGEEIRRDETATDDYHGVAPDGTLTSSAAWFVVRFYKTSGLITRVRARSGVVWDDRTLGW